MSVLLVLLAAVVVGGAYWFLTRKDSDAAVKNAVDEVKDVLDVNNDGKVNVEDAKAAVDVVKTKTKAAAGKAKTATKKAVGGARSKNTNTNQK